LLSEIDVLIDDFYDNLIGGKYSKIVLDYPWNRNYDDDKHFVHRCKDWFEIDKELEYWDMICNICNIIG
jgi:5'(3')-deoxyribonucleotidase